MGDLHYGNGVGLLCAQVVLHSVIATAVGVIRVFGNMSGHR